jgi:hypothetical protein
MKNSLLLLFLIFCTVQSFAQYDVDKVEDEKEGKKSKMNWTALKNDLYVGGGVNANFGSYSYIYFSPFIGYEFLPHISSGISTMIRFEQNSNGVGLLSKGAGVFVRYKPEIPILLETSYNIYSTSFKGVSQEPLPAKSVLIGVGYAQPIGDRSYAQVMLQYDVLRNPNVPENILLSFPGFGRVYYKFGFVYYLGN